MKWLMSLMAMVAICYVSVADAGERIVLKTKSGGFVTFAEDGTILKISQKTAVVQQQIQPQQSQSVSAIYSTTTLPPGTNFVGITATDQANRTFQRMRVHSGTQRYRIYGSQQFVNYSTSQSPGNVAASKRCTCGCGKENCNCQQNQLNGTAATVPPPAENSQ